MAEPTENPSQSPSPPAAPPEPAEVSPASRPPVPARRRLMASLHRGSVVFFGVFGAYFLSIYLGLWVSMGFSLLLDAAPLWFMKFVAVPLVLEGGLGLSGLAVLYLLGRFVELPLVASQIGFWLGLRALDVLMKFLLGQFADAYGDGRLLALRLPVLALFAVLGHFVFRAALRRHRA